MEGNYLLFQLILVLKNKRSALFVLPVNDLSHLYVYHLAGSLGVCLLVAFLIGVIYCSEGVNHTILANDALSDLSALFDVI